MPTVRPVRGGVEADVSSDSPGICKSLAPTIDILYPFSTTLYEGFGLYQFFRYSCQQTVPANLIFAGVGILLSAATDVEASQEVIIDLFERIEYFFKRLEYTSTIIFTMLKIIVEVPDIFAIATKEMEQKSTEYLVGRNDIENTLKRLDKLTQEEARMAAAENLKLTQIR
ncbi:hypothetical protein EI94DRAFT_1700183 [Lactarius quietus]|nr:hypothetical protein EI94DRAFT_1700183 [Lactarius quietus]